MLSFKAIIYSARAMENRPTSAATVAFMVLIVLSLLLSLGVDGEGGGDQVKDTRRVQREQSESSEEEEEDGNTSTNEQDINTKPLLGNPKHMGLLVHTQRPKFGLQRYSFLRGQHRPRRRRSARRKIQERMFTELQVMETIKYFLPKFEEDIFSMSMYDLQFNTKPIFDGEVKLDALEDIIVKYSDSSDPNRIHVLYVILDVYAALILKIDDHMQKVQEHVEGIWKKNKNIGRAQGSINLWLTSFRRKLRLRARHVQTFLNVTFSPDLDHTCFLASYQPGRHLSLIRLLQKHNVTSPLRKLNDGLYTLQPVTEPRYHVPLFSLSSDQHNLSTRADVQEPDFENDTKRAESENEASREMGSRYDDEDERNSLETTTKSVVKSARRSERSLAEGDEDDRELSIKFLRIHADVIKEDGALYSISFAEENEEIPSRDVAPRFTPMLHPVSHHSHHMERHEPPHQIETNNPLSKGQTASHHKTPNDIISHQTPPEQVLPGNMTKQKTSDRSIPLRRTSHRSVKKSNPWVTTQSSLVQEPSHYAMPSDISYQTASHVTSNQTTRQNMSHSNMSHLMITQPVQHETSNQTTRGITLHELPSDKTAKVFTGSHAKAEIVQRKKQQRRPHLRNLEHPRRGISIIRMGDEQNLLVQKTPSDLFFLCLRKQEQELKTTRTSGRDPKNDHTLSASFCTSYTGLSSHWYLLPIIQEGQKEVPFVEMEPMVD